VRNRYSLVSVKSVRTPDGWPQDGLDEATRLADADGARV